MWNLTKSILINNSLKSLKRKKKLYCISTCAWQNELIVNGSKIFRQMKIVKRILTYDKSLTVVHSVYNLHIIDQVGKLVQHEWERNT